MSMFSLYFEKSACHTPAQLLLLSSVKPQSHIIGCICCCTVILASSNKLKSRVMKFDIVQTAAPLKNKEHNQNDK